MDKVRFQVLGYRDFKKKSDGKSLTVVTVGYYCTPSDNENGSYGMKVKDCFLPDDRVGTLTPACIGQEFVPSYGLNGFGNPRLDGFELKAWK